MEESILDFVTIKRRRDGTAKITCCYQNEENTYKKIRELGFRKVKLDNKDIYIQKEANRVTLSDIEKIRQSFKDFLAMELYSTSSISISHSDFFNEYWQIDPIKKNSFYEHLIIDTLTEDETHQLRMKTDFSYKHNYNIQKVLEMLNKWEFSKTVDLNSTLTTNAPLYYRKIDKQSFIIFTHYCAGEKNNTDGFDCFITKFKKTSHIGLEKPIEWDLIIKTVDFDRDYSLIEKYLNN